MHKAQEELAKQKEVIVSQDKALKVYLAIHLYIFIN